MQKCPWALKSTCHLHFLIAAEAFWNESSLAHPLGSAMADAASLFAKAKADTRLSVTDAVMTCTDSLKELCIPAHCKRAPCIQEKAQIANRCVYCATSCHVFIASFAATCPVGDTGCESHSQETDCLWCIAGHNLRIVCWNRGCYFQRHGPIFWYLRYQLAEYF